MQMQFEQFLTTLEVAAKLRVTPVTVRTWVRDGMFPKPVQINRLMRFSAREVDEFLRTRGGSLGPGSLAGGISQPICGGPSDV